MTKSRDKKTPSLPTELQLRYPEAQFVAKGDAAEVFRVTSKGKPQALKIFSDARVWERELRVATMVQPSTSPALLEVVRIADVDRSICALSYEWIEGVPLDAWIEGRAKREGDRTLRSVVLQIAHALEDLSDAGWRHGDIKPANILVRAREQADSHDAFDVHLIDWSLAAPLGESVEGYTPHFAAPEVRASGEVLSVQGDVYALGKWVTEIALRCPWMADDRVLMDLAKELLLEKPTHRPTPKEIVRRLATSGSTTTVKPQQWIDRALFRECVNGEGFSFPELESAPTIDRAKRHLQDGGMPIEETRWSTLRKMRWLVRLLGTRASYWSRAVERNETTLYRALTQLAKSNPL